MKSAFCDLNLVACAIVVTDKEGRIWHCNQRLADMVGQSIPNLLQARLWDIAPNETKIFLQTHIIPSLLHDEQVSEIYVRLINEHGERIPVLLNAQKFVDSGADFFSWAIFSAQNRHTLERKIIDARSHAERDAKKLSKIGMELKRSNEALENFAYIASHDLKAPLLNIRQLLEFIEEDAGPALDESCLEFMTLARGKAGALMALMDDLLTYSRAGTHHGGISRINLHEFVRDIHQLLNLEDAFGLDFIGDMDMETLTVPLKLVIRNLFNNAIKHHDRSTGRIQFSCVETGGHYEMTVSDDGPGIDPIYHNKIFEMFKKLEGGDSNKGSGMGLALVRRTLEAYGGRIFVAANHQRGSKFSFTWPTSKILQDMISVD